MNQEYKFTINERSLLRLERGFRKFSEFLRKLVALPENLSSVFRIYNRQLTTFITPVLRDGVPSSGLPRHLITHSMHLHRHTCIYISINNLKK